MRKLHANANILMIKKIAIVPQMLNVIYLRLIAPICIISLVWYDSTSSSMKKLKTAYNNCLRRFLGILKYNSGSQTFTNLNIPPFEF